MKVRMTTSMAGADFAVHAGDEVELDAESARRIIAAGFAVEVKKRGKGAEVEKAVASAPETPEG